ncbi:hypothetical protein ACAG39_07120 [Caldicellulosiruptoraceae bacterium PP1]
MSIFKEGFIKKGLLKPMKLIRDLAISNDYISGIEIFFVYFLLLVVYAFAQFKFFKGIFVLQDTYMFYFSSVKSETENFRLINFVISNFSSLALKLIVEIILIYFLVWLLNRKKYSISFAITSVTVPFLIPIYIILLGVIFSFLPIHMFVLKLSEIAYLISLYETTQKTYGITKEKSLVVTLGTVFLVTLFFHP